LAGVDSLHRLAALKQRLFDIPQICTERARLVTESYKETENLHPAMRVAKAFEHVLSNKALPIGDSELIVGSLGAHPKGVPLYPEFGVRFLEREIDEFDKRPFDKYLVSPDDKSILRNEVIPYWKGRSREDRSIAFASDLLPDEVKPAWDPDSFAIKPVIYAGYRKASGDGHVVVDYERVLNVGMKGLLDEAERALSGTHLGTHEGPSRRLFLRAVITCLKAAIAFSKRYSNEASRLAAREHEPERRKELEAIAAVCERVPEHPARSFHEALQATWFAHMLLWMESNGHSVGLGRMDQYLYPYYKADMESGKLTSERVLELLGCFFVKVCEIKKIRPWPETQYKSGYPTFQAITVGGQTAEGRDATNELSYAILDVTAQMRLPEPVVVVRVHEGSPHEFLMKAGEALVKHGGGLPSFFGDRAIIGAMTDAGIPLDDARNHAIIACSEPVVPGKHVSHTGSSTYLNLPKILEMSLNGGVDPATKLGLHPVQGSLGDFESFDEVFAAFREQLSYYAAFVPALNNITSYLDTIYYPSPYTSSLLAFRIEMGKDMSEGGGPNETNTIVQGHGLPNVANALYALKKQVFDDKALTAAAVHQALLSDFAGPDGERIRQILYKSSKYGNDQEDVDSMAAQVAKVFTEEVRRHDPPWRGGVFGVSFQGLTANVPEGRATGATPDGRRAGEALADNLSPQAGTDVNGPTAVTLSVSKIDQSRCLNGNLLNLKFHPTAVAGEGLSKLIALIKTYLVDLSGWQVQFNIVSADKLKAAQAEPDLYRDLIVKVAGYSAQFISLDRALQDQIIQRTEHLT
jgi:formate C-acetyltransferase